MTGLDRSYRIARNANFYMDRDTARPLGGASHLQKKNGALENSFVASLALILLAIAFLVMPQLKYFSLHSNYYDMGVLYNYIHLIGKGDLGWMLVGHWSPVRAAYGVVDRIFNTGAVILFLQSAAMLSSIVPAFLIAREVMGQTVFDHTTKNYLSRLFPALLFLYPPMWWNNLFDFHPDHLAISLCLWIYLFSIRDRRILYVLFLLVLATVKEMFFFTAALICLVSAIKRRGVVMNSFLSLGFFAGGLFVMEYVLPAYSPGGNYFTDRSDAFGWLGMSIPEISKNILLNPLAIVKEVMLNPLKIFFFVKVFYSFAFLALVSPLMLLPSLPDIAFALLSKNPNHFTYTYQYSVDVVPFVYISSLYGFTRASALVSRRRLILMILASSLSMFVLFSPSPLSIRFWSDKFAYNWTWYYSSERTALIKKAIQTHIPPNKEVSVSTHNCINNDLLSRRLYYWSFPIGVDIFEQWRRKRTADYAVIDNRCKPFVNDRVDPERYAQALKALREGYEPVYEYDGFYIYKQRQ